MTDLQVVGMVMLRVHDMLSAGMYVSSYEAAMIERLEHAMNLLADSYNGLHDFPVPDGLTTRQAAEMAARP